MVYFLHPLSLSRIRPIRMDSQTSSSDSSALLSSDTRLTKLARQKTILYSIPPSSNASIIRSVIKFFYNHRVAILNALKESDRVCIARTTHSDPLDRYSFEARKEPRLFIPVLYRVPKTCFSSSRGRIDSRIRGATTNFTKTAQELD